MTELEFDYRLVYESMGPGHDKDRQYLSDKYGVPINNLADLNALGSMLFERLTPAQKERDLKDIEEQLSSAASILGRKGGRAKSEAKAKAARENAKKGGWPKGRPRNTELTDLQRQALDLRQQGLSIREIAARMDRQPENIRQLLARAASKLSIPGGWAGIKSQEV